VKYQAVSDFNTKFPAEKFCAAEHPRTKERNGPRTGKGELRDLIRKSRKFTRTRAITVGDEFWLFCPHGYLAETSSANLG
jgi:hypothetical protein